MQQRRFRIDAKRLGVLPRQDLRELNREKHTRRQARDKNSGLEEAPGGERGEQLGESLPEPRDHQ